jgi:hypothetical protein
MTEDISVLKNRRVERVFQKDERTLILETSGAELAFVQIYTEGDCCSEAWFNHLTGIEALQGGIVLECEETGWKDAETTRQEADTVDFIKIRTDKGFCDIEVRQSSNEYYGGWVTYSKTDSIENCKEITSDF